MRERTGRRRLWWILGLALVVRLAAGGWWQSRLEPGQAFHFGDTESYWELAQAVAARRPLEFRSAQRKVFRSPGYPLLLALDLPRRRTGREPSLTPKRLP